MWRFDILSVFSSVTTWKIWKSTWILNYWYIVQISVIFCLHIYTYFHYIYIMKPKYTQNLISMVDLKSLESGIQFCLQNKFITASFRIFLKLTGSYLSKTTIVFRLIASFGFKMNFSKIYTFSQTYMSNILIIQH